MEVITKVKDGMFLKINGAAYKIIEMSLDSTPAGTHNNFYFKASSPGKEDVTIEFPPRQEALTLNDVKNMVAFFND